MRVVRVLAQLEWNEIERGQGDVLMKKKEKSTCKRSLPASVLLALVPRGEKPLSSLHHPRMPA